MIELGKTFDFMDFPNRTHSISEGPGTTVHIFKLLARHLTTHLPPNPDLRILTLLLGNRSRTKSTA
jgi:dipeptidyl-peptidase 4